MWVGVRAQQKQQQHFAWLWVCNTLFVLTRMDLCCSFQAHTRKKEKERDTMRMKKMRLRLFFSQMKTRAEKRTIYVHVANALCLRCFFWFCLYLLASLGQRACFVFTLHSKKRREAWLLKLALECRDFLGICFPFEFVSKYTLSIFFYLSFVNTYIERSSQFFFLSVCYLLNV